MGSPQIWLELFRNRFELAEGENAGKKCLGQEGPHDV